MPTVSVTSLAEVWIETKNLIDANSYFSSLPLRKCGLKQEDKTNVDRTLGHFPCGSVD